MDKRNVIIIGVVGVIVGVIVAIFEKEERDILFKERGLNSTTCKFF